MLNLSFSKKIILKNTLKIIFIIICFLLIVYFGLGYSLNNIIENKRWLDPMFITVMLSFSLGLIFGILEMRFLDKLSDYLDRIKFSLTNAIKGNWGEREAFKKLKEVLGSQYIIYPNFHIPDKKIKFDNDAVIIGPKGIICIEIKNIKGVFDFIGEETYKYDLHNKNQCRDTLNEHQSPSKEVLRHSYFLQKWLERNDFNGIRPKPILLLVGDRAMLNSKPQPQGYYVVRSLEELSDTFQNTHEDNRFNEELCRNLVGLFGNKYLK